MLREAWPQARIGVFVPFRVASNGGPALGVMGSPRAKLVPNWCTTQWIEQRFPKPCVAGSIPAGATSQLHH